MSHSSRADATPKMAPPAPPAGAVLHQSRGVSSGPGKLAVAGLAIVGSIAYFTLYSKKKPEASMGDVARVATGVGATPEHTHSK